jgi:hypothetical protein
MSTSVDLSELATAVADYRFAYLLSNTAAGPPHAVAVTPTLGAGVLTVEGLGHRTVDNLTASPAVCLLWPPTAVDGYSLIVDCRASLDGEVATLTPERAVLHRPAPALGADSTCGSDCVDLPVR